LAAEDCRSADHAFVATGRSEVSVRESFPQTPYQIPGHVGLIGEEQQGAVRFADCRETGPYRAREASLPPKVLNERDALRVENFTDSRGVRAEHNDHRIAAARARRLDGPGEERLPLEEEHLLPSS